MKRNMDLVRDIMLLVESNDMGLNTDEITVTGHKRPEIEYHFMILFEAGLLAFDADVSDLDSGFGSWLGVRLTWAGHDFLDAARSPEVWTRARTTIVDRVGSVTFEVLKALLVEISKQYLGLTA